MQYQYDSTSGEFSKPSLFVETEPKCFPDGSTVDTEGCLWNAQWGASKVVRYRPNGSVDLELPVPTSQPTCVAFGGAERNLLFVTSAWLEMSSAQRQKDEFAGSLFIYETPYRGIVDASFPGH